jgi:hypothetical protein
MPTMTTGAVSAAGLAVALVALPCPGVFARGLPADSRNALAAELITDAERRDSVPAPEDRRFTARISGLIHFRYNWNSRREDIAHEQNDTIGFQAARMRIRISGNVLSEGWGYAVDFGFTPGGSVRLEDGYGTFEFADDWELMFGQFRLPFTREELIGNSFLLAADRSAANQVFNQGRSQGILLTHRRGDLRLRGAVSDGGRARNTDFADSSGDTIMLPGEGAPRIQAPVADWALTGRADWKWAGTWTNERDLTSFPERDFFGMLGVAGHMQSGGDTGAIGPRPMADLDLWSATTDLSLGGSGWNMFAALHVRHVQNRDAALLPIPEDRYTDWGFVVQGGIFITRQSELFARWDGVIPDADWDAIGRGSEFHTLTAGVNHYVAPESHAAKLTVDLQWFLDAQARSIVPHSTLLGLLPDARDNQWNLRGQLQIAF